MFAKQKETLQSNTLCEIFTGRTESPCPGTVEFDALLAAVWRGCTGPVGKENHVVSFREGLEQTHGRIR